MATVTIFGGSHAKEGEPDYEKARELGRALARAGHAVCNGGYGGIMEASARGAKEAGGLTMGVTTEDFGGPANVWIGEEIRMKKWAKRLFKLVELGDAYVVFDGGTGTLVELFVLWEMTNKAFIQKPIILFGAEFQKLVSQIKKWPQVTGSARIVFATSQPEVLTAIKGKK